VPPAMARQPIDPARHLDSYNDIMSSYAV
jgi:hypothetical protein